MGRKGIERRGRGVDVTRTALFVLALALAALTAATPAQADIDFAPQGSGAGQLHLPGASIAVDYATGEVFVAEGSNNGVGNARVSVFDEDGDFLRAFGWGVDTGAAKLETCTTASTCQAGLPGSGAGQLQAFEPQIAVDNDPTSPSFGDVFVYEAGNARVERFTAAGAFVLAFGDGVNQTTGGDVCTAASGNTCKGGVEGFGPGHFNGNKGIARIALGAGIVHVADCSNCEGGGTHRVQTFDPSGAPIGQPLTVTGAAVGRPAGLAAAPDGDFYLSTSGEPGVHWYDSAGSLLGVLGSFILTPLALDSADNLYVTRGEASTSLYDPSGTLLSVIYGEEPRGQLRGVAARSTPTGDFYVLDPQGTEKVAHIKFEPPGPVVLPRAAQIGDSPSEIQQAHTKATSVGSLTVTLNARVNPEGKATTAHFEYVDDASYQANGFAGATATPESSSVGSDFSPHDVSFDVTCASPGQPGCLTPETVYHLRAVATNPDGKDTGTEATFETGPPIVLGDTWSTQVGSDSARLHARLNPSGIPTTARFEYVEQASFEASGFAGATLTPELDFGAGSGMSARSTLIGSLKAGTTYRYRYIATNFFGSYEGPTGSFTTFSAALPPKTDCPNQALRGGAAATLPDCRAYELVSPLEKGNGDVVPSGAGSQFGVPAEQAAPGGDALAYTSFRAFGDAVSSPFTSQYLARRDPATGWSTHSLNPPLGGGNLYEGVYQRPIYKGFSEDLCNGWLTQNSDLTLAPEAPAGVPNIYRRSNCGGDAYELLTTVVPPGFSREGEEGTESVGDTGSKYFAGAGGWSEDGTLSAFKAGAALTPEASVVGAGKQLTCELGSFTADGAALAYQWLRNGAPIGGASKETYETTAADTSKAIQCRIRATNSEEDENSGGKAGAVGVSNPAQIVAPAPATMPPIAPAFIPAPEASAPLTVGGPGGQTLSCDPREAGWRGSPSAFSYEWYRNGVPPAAGSGAITKGSTTVNTVVTTTGSGTLTAGSTTVSGLSATTGVFAVGQTITAPAGIPAETTIAAVGEGTLELSQAATASGPQALSAGPQPFAVGWTISATGIPAGTTITSISGQTLTLSAPATLTLGKVPLAAMPTTPTYSPGAPELARAAAFQCVITATNAGGSVSIASANLATTGPTPEPSPPHPRAFVLDVYRVYAKQGGELALVSVLPSGEAVHTHAAVGTRAPDGPADNNAVDSVLGAVSAGGERIFFSATSTEPPQPIHQNIGVLVPRSTEGASRLYLRINPMAEQSAVEEAAPGEFHCTEAGKACTVAISEGIARFIGADPGAAKALYLEGEDLYEVDIEKAIAYEAGAAIQIASGALGVMGMSEDLARAYLVSEALCSGAATNSEGEAAQAGEPNLYLYEEGESCEAGELAFIAGLAGGDVVRGAARLSVIDEPFLRRSRVSGDGLHATFMSRAQLSEYDNTDANGDGPAAEVYIYDAAEGKLRCASCNPGGERPAGVKVGSFSEPAWIAAQIPGWATQWHPSRALSEDGRLYFESFEALVARDANGSQDVYQWQEAHSKAECEEAGAERYVPASEGCLSLISSGTSPADSEFIDASASGADVFFRTASSLVAEDYGLVDIYDARVGGGFPAPEEPPAGCEGEACQGAPSPPNDPTPASASFQGAGNVSEAPAATKPRRCGRGKVRRKGRCVARKQRKRAKQGSHTRANAKRGAQR